MATVGGMQAISSVVTGTLVLAYDEATGETGYYTVTAVWAHEDPVVTYVAVGAEVIEATPEHPFYTPMHGWLTAGELWAGVLVRDAAGAYEPVDWVVSVAQPQPQTMWNLTVDAAHTFFVGDGLWLVHNACQLGPYRSLDPDSHHIIQDAAVQDVPGYVHDNAPAMRLDGPSTARNSEHYLATQAQNSFRGGGTYGAERRAGYFALRKAGKSIEDAKAAVRYADRYFMGELKLDPRLANANTGNAVGSQDQVKLASSTCAQSHFGHK